MDEMELLSKLGCRIKELRLSKSMTQNDLAFGCGFENASMSRIESGKTNITLRSLIKICNALDISVTEVFKCNAKNNISANIKIKIPPCIA